MISIKYGTLVFRRNDPIYHRQKAHFLRNHNKTLVNQPHDLRYFHTSPDVLQQFPCVQFSGAMKTTMSYAKSSRHHYGPLVLFFVVTYNLFCYGWFVGQYWEVIWLRKLIDKGNRLYYLKNAVKLMTRDYLFMENTFWFTWYIAQLKTMKR